MASKRISLLAKLASQGDMVVDIGCDHGYTLLEVCKNNPNIKRAYALDINDGPLSQAKNTFSATKYNHLVEFYLSNGLKEFDLPFDTAIISGMGGSLISQILEDSKDKFIGKTLILEPQGNINLVRRWLYSNGYDIVDEYDLLENNKYYNFIVSKEVKEKVKYNVLDINYGPILRHLRTKEFIDYWTKIYNNFTNIKNKPLEIRTKLLELDYILNNKEIYRDDLFTLLPVKDSNKYVIIFPGGAYKFTTERESEVLGIHYNACGYNVIVVNYLDLNLSLKEMYQTVANRLNNYFKDKPKALIYYVGFSAGGHFALELSNHLSYYKLKGNGLILGYPLVSTKQELTHEESLKFIKQELKDNEILRYSEELEVNKDSLPMFIFTTSNDEEVDIMNTFVLCNAYSKLDISYECHVLGPGLHGCSLATKETARTPSDIDSNLSRWFELALKWMNN